MKVCNTSSRLILLAPTVVPLAGSDRESLHSVLKRICETNQLTVNAVLAGIVLPSLKTPQDRLTKMVSPVHLINRGCLVSIKLVAQLQELTGMSGLSKLTLQELVGLRGIGVLAITRYRKWCPACFDDDVETAIGPYDRLIWSISDVQACPVHHAMLQSICQSCGAGPFMALMGCDLSGRCPKCRGWLGGKAIILDQNRDEHSRYLLWTAQSYADLLESPLPAQSDVSQGVKKLIIALAEQHFDGAKSRLAQAVERNKSVISTWLTGHGSPSWRALCEISFTFQIPLSDMLRGLTDGVALSTARHLPLAIADRLSRPRKLPERRNLQQIRSFMARVECGELPHIVTLEGMAERLNITGRELRRLVPEDISRLSKVLADRRITIRKKMIIARDRAIREEIPVIVSNLLNAGTGVTRRVIDKQLSIVGLAVRRGEARLISQLVQSAIKDNVTTKYSGNK
jgi:transcriptional regulator with XRE-family HTH domain